MSLPNSTNQTPAAPGAVSNHVPVEDFRVSDWLTSKGLRKLNLLAAIARALVNPQVSRTDGTDADEVIIADGNWTLQIGIDPSGNSNGGSGKILSTTLVSVQDDSITCTDGTTTYIVAKHFRLCHSIASATILGVAHAYSSYAITNYPSSGTVVSIDTTRIDTYGSIVDGERVIPVWQVGEVIDIVQCDTGLTVSGSPVVWKMVTPKLWVKQSV